MAQIMSTIGPSASRHVVEHAVIFERNFVYRAKNFKKWGRYGVLTKQQKAAAKKFAVALQRLDMALNDSDLVMNLKVEFPMDEFDLKRWRERADAAAETKLGQPKRTDRGKQRAVVAAAKLLKKHDLPTKVTRGGPFCRLAAVLYGDEDADLFRHCRAYKNKPDPGQK